MPTYVTNHDPRAATDAIHRAKERADADVAAAKASVNKADESQTGRGAFPMDQPFSPVAYPNAAIPATTEPQQEGHEEKRGASDFSMWTRITTYFSLLLFVFIAHFREVTGRLFEKDFRRRRPGYAPLVKDFDDYWNRRFYRRIRDCWNRPIDSRPSRVIGVMERVSHDYNATFEFTGRIIPAVNLGSYNYLGFAEDTPSITHDVLDCIDDHGLASCSAPHEAGQSDTVAKLEKAFAEFVGKDDAVVCGMGFGTNFKGLPALFGKGTLCISDHLNHSSIVNGVRSSGAKVGVFQHGDYDGLEKVLRQAVILGQDPANNLTNYKPWDRIVILVEGIYSMEGEIVDLKRVVELKRKYKALLFVDEAHSIGAIGKTGRGVCEHCGVDPADVDVLMGTFTKSFGSIGGYIAADQKIIDYIRLQSAITLHCDTLAPPCCQQIISVLDVLQGKDGTNLGKERIAQLKDNAQFFRQGLVKLGLHVLGDDASPVIPVMAYNFGKLPFLARTCLERGLAIVVVGYPATALLESRIRFCISACHTREDLQYVLDVMKELSEEVYITYCRESFLGIPLKKSQKMVTSA